MTITRGNYNVANRTTLSGVIDEVLKNYSLTLENCMPAVVESFDREKNIVKVKPAINVILTNNEIQERATIELPVHTFGGNGIIISTPLKKGDTGFIIAGDRDISLFKQSLNVSNPNTIRFHKYSFGFFIPDKIKGFTVNNRDTDALTIQTLDGTTRIAIKDSEITVVSKSNVNVTSPNVNVSASSVSITGDTTINGNLTVSSNIVASGNITGSDVMSASYSLETVGGIVADIGGNIGNINNYMQNHIHTYEYYNGYTTTTRDSGKGVVR